MATAGRPSSDAMRERARYNAIINAMSSWAVIDFFVKTHAHVAGAGAADVEWDDEFSVTVKQLRDCCSSVDAVEVLTCASR